MNSDLFRQWQTFGAMLNPGAGAYGTGLAGFAPDASFATYAESAERFGGELKRFFDAVTAAGGQAAAAAAQALSDALRERFSGYFPALHGAGMASDAAARQPGGTIPALGLTREHQQRWQRAVTAWNRMTEAQRRLQRLWSDALREASSTFAQRLAASKPTMPDAEGLHRLYSQWIDCAEDAYARVAHSEAFCDTLAEFINAGSAWRQALKESVEEWSKWLDLPTRHELNSLLQRLQAVEQRPAASDRTRTPQQPKAARNATQPRTHAKPRKAKRAAPARPRRSRP